MFSTESEFIYLRMIMSVLWVVVSVIQICSSVNEDGTLTSEEDEIYYKATYSDTACLFSYDEDHFSAADASNATIPEDSIFFIETSCKGGLDFRQACSVETAARTHPNKQINVLFAGRDSTKKDSERNFLKVLLKYKNVKFFKVHITDFAKGTPLEDVVIKDLKRSRYVMYHASDLLRFLTLYKFGGTYLDLDVFVVRSFDHLPVKNNWIGRDTDVGLAVGLLALSQNGIGKELINEIFSLLKSNFKVDVWGGNGINVITKALEEVCSMSWEDISPETCKGFKIYEPTYFYPVVSDKYERFLQPFNGTLNLTNVYAFHLWNYLITGEDIQETSLHAVLSRKYCPKIDKTNNEYVKYNKSKFPHQPQHIRTLRLQRTKVDILYNNIDINLKEKMLKRHTKSVFRNLHHQHRQPLNSFKRKILPNYQNKYYEAVRKYLYFNRPSKHVKIQRKKYLIR